MLRKLVSILLLGIIGLSFSEVYFQENFENGHDHWVFSSWKGEEQGNFELGVGTHVGENFKDDMGLKTMTDNRFYTASAKFDKPFSNKDKDLVIQYSVRHNKRVECGGSYIKLYPGEFNQTELSESQKYNIMFGPDICSFDGRIHVIFNHNEKNHLLEEDIVGPRDTISHLYTLIIRPDDTFEVRVDGETERTGSLLKDFSILPPMEIEDPNATKPEDWVDLEEIDDPEDVKPEDWDVESLIKDPSAVKPEDWDEELDGDWDHPLIPNPDYKGEWKPRKIPNPEYKGDWVHPKIPNPDYKEVKGIYAYDEFSHIGIEVWQVTSESIFDDFLITDSVEEAEKVLPKFLEKQTEERKAREEYEKEQLDVELNDEEEIDFEDLTVKEKKDETEEKKDETEEKKDETEEKKVEIKEKTEGTTKDEL